MAKCRICDADLKKLLDFGPQPICNRFLKNPREKEYLHPLVIGQCGSCALIQLIDPPLASEVRPRYEWITYNEPEAHLDRLAVVISQLPSITKRSVIWGMSFKDDSLLKRLSDAGFNSIYRVDTENDLKIYDAGIGVETIQDRLGPEAAEAITGMHGRPNVLIARHILEHCHDLRQFIETLKKIIAPGGYIVLEVPDFTPSLEKFDYSTVWEEHIISFTPKTFLNTLNLLGIPSIYFEIFPSVLDNALVSIGKIENASGAGELSDVEISSEKAKAGSFSEGFGQVRSKMCQALSRMRKEKGKIAFFGSGHLACTFIGLLGLKDLVEFVVDDNLNKQGLYMPGSHLPIVGSKRLLDDDIKIAFLSVGLESENKVIEKNKGFADKGGGFFSIFPGSERALRI